MANSGQIGQRAAEETEEDLIKCINAGKMENGENALNFSALLMVSRDAFSTYKLNECVVKCLQLLFYSHVLISYEDDIFSKDEYNCMCAQENAFSRNARLPEYKCNNKCPGNNEKYRSVSIPLHCYLVSIWHSTKELSINTIYLDRITPVAEPLP